MLLFNPILSNEILSPRELLDKLELKVEDNIKIDRMTWDEFENIFPDIWTYSLNDITHIIESGRYVYICKFDDGIIRYVEDSDYSEDESLFSEDFDIDVSYEKNTNSLVINSGNCTGIRYYLGDKSEVGIRVQDYIDNVVFIDNN